MRLTKYNMNLLQELNELLHDKWFDVNNLAFDEPEMEFKLTFGQHKGVYDQHLKISGVLSCEIIDTEKVQIYDIYELSIDLQQGKIRITGCIPITITLGVSEDFEITTGGKRPKYVVRRRKYRCPECRAKLKEFGIDLDAIEVQCPRCHAQFSPLQVFKDSDIVFFSQILPQDRQEAFLTRLGFEKQAVRSRIPKALLYSLFSILVLGAAFLSVMLALDGYRIKALGPVLGGLLLCFAIYRDYKDEEKPRWRRRRESRRSAP
jgi:hypothetical protein